MFTKKSSRCSVLHLTWQSIKRKCCIIHGHSTMAALIFLSLFRVGVNNDQNTHGPLSSFPLSLSASLASFLYLIQCADDDSEISFSYCLLPHSDKCTHQLRPWGQGSVSCYLLSALIPEQLVLRILGQTESPASTFLMKYLVWAHLFVSARINTV